MQTAPSLPFLYPAQALSPYMFTSWPPSVIGVSPVPSTEPGISHECMNECMHAYIGWVKVHSCIC